MTHELKLDIRYWNDVIDGRKTFEVRLNDRDYRVNDLIQFCIWDGRTCTDVRSELYRITYMLPVSQLMNLDEEWCVFSIEKASTIQDELTIQGDQIA